MILVDTNVLVYAIGGAHELREPARRVIDGVQRGAIPGATIGAVYLEFLHVYSRRRSPAAAAAAIQDLITLLGLPIELLASELVVAAGLYERHTCLEAVDAALAAVSLRPEVEGLVTADRAFFDVPGVRVLDPRSPELARMLA